ncbi:MAG: hypothetical protein G01um101491_35, partial [Parcubacteria group bacterium Gr01-1014_91]
MKYRLEYAQMRSASFDPEASIGERKTETIEAESYDAAERA